MAEARRMRGWRRAGAAAFARIAAVLAALLVGAVMAPAGATAQAGGTLKVRVLGLPRTVNPRALLTGPHLHLKVSARMLTIHHARPGRYTLRVLPLTVTHPLGAIRSGAKAYPSGKGQVSTRLAAGRTTSLTGTYGSIVNPGLVSVKGGVLSVGGSPDNPTSLTLAGNRPLKGGEVLSLRPRAILPRGLLKRVGDVRHAPGKTTVTLRPVSVFSVVPVGRFDVPLLVHIASARDAAGRKLRSSFATDCGPSVAGASGVYRTVKNVRFAGGWNTVSIFGKQIPIGVSLGVDFDLEAGIKDALGAELEASCELDFPFSGMAGPVPLTGAVFGDIHGSVDAGVGFTAGLGVHVHAGADSVGVPPALVWSPQLSLSNPTVNVSALAEVSASAGFGAGVKFGLGNDLVADATLNFNNDLDFSAQASVPDGSGCKLQAKFASFDAEGKVGGWTIKSPSTPPLFTKTLWGPRSCEPTAPTPPPPPSPPLNTPWSVQSTPEPNPSLPHTAVLNSVSCTSTTSCVAVGSYQVALNTTAPLTESWNGARWSLESVPAPSTPNGSLYSVSCTSASACTAVGYALQPPAAGLANEPEDAFAEVWNGSEWKLVTLPDPAPGTFEMDLSAVSCTSTAVCTAVGWYTTGSGRILLVERQSGASWTDQTPASVSSDNQFTSVSCTSASRCTAVGGYYANAPSGLIFLPFADTWDGTQWSPQTTPSPPDADAVTQLQSVSCTSASACTAVGFYSYHAGLATLTERWDGTSWTIQSTPAPPVHSNAANLNGVDCVSSTTCTAVGSGIDIGDLFSERWAGAGWSILGVPDPSSDTTPPDFTDGDTLDGVSCPTASTCFAVGHYHGGGALVERATGL